MLHTLRIIFAFKKGVDELIMSFLLNITCIYIVKI